MLELLPGCWVDPGMIAGIYLTEGHLFFTNVHGEAVMACSVSIDEDGIAMANTAAGILNDFRKSIRDSYEVEHEVLNKGLH